MTVDITNIDATDPSQLCGVVSVDNANTMGARLATEPPPHVCCPMAPANVKNGGEPVSLEESSVCQKIKDALPEAQPLPALCQNFETAHNTVPAGPQSFPIPEFNGGGTGS